jgi:hypothetical protein
MRTKGVRKVEYIRYRSQTVAIEICFPFNFAVVFDLSISVSAPVKQNQLVMSSQIGKARHLGSWFYFSFIMRIS